MRPSARLLVLLFLPLLCSLCVPFFTGAQRVWAVALLLVCIIAAADLLSLLRTPVPKVHREMPGSLAVGRFVHISILINCETAMHRAAGRDRDGSVGRPTDRAASCRRSPLFGSRRIDIADHYPAQGDQEGLPYSTFLPPKGEQLIIGYQFRPLERGELSFGRTVFRLYSPLRLWSRQRSEGGEQKVRVYPDFKAIFGYRLLENEGKIPLTGMRRTRRRGEGTEFDQLREYRNGDPLRSVDWKATARFGKLISRQYTEEHDQHVVFLLDTGYRVTGGGTPITHFDYILNAMILMAHIALQQGDSVGLSTFGARERHLQPSKRTGTLNRIMNTVFDIQAAPVPTDLGTALETAAQSTRRRTLFILLSKLRENDGERLAEAIGIIGTRHVIVCASLRDRSVERLLVSKPQSFDEAVAHASAVRYLRNRDRVIKLLRGKGLLVFDEYPEKMAAALAEHYRAIKGSGML